MNFKKLISVAVALQLVFSQAAAATLKDISTEPSEDGKSAVITGAVDQTGGAADKVVIKILMPGKTEGNITAANILTTVVAVESVDVNENNTFSTTIGMPNLSEHGRDVKSGKYNVYFSGEGITPPALPSSFWYITPDTITTVITQIQGATSEDEVEDILFDLLLDEDGVTPLDYNNADLLSVKGALYTNVSAAIGEGVLTAGVAGVVFAERATVTDLPSLKQKIKLATVMTALDNSQSAALVDGLNNFKESVFAENTDGAEAEALYTNNVTFSGKGKTLSALSGKNLAAAGTAAFETAFVKQAVYDAVFNYAEGGVAQSGHGHIPTVLAVGENAYTNVSAFLSIDPTLQQTHALTILNSGVTTPETLDTKIYNILNPAPIDPPGPDGDGGYYGGTAVQGGEYTENLKEESEQREQAALGGFTDLANHSWATEAIEYLSDKNIIVGTSSTTFEPERSIKRGEFAKILVLALGLDVSDAKSEFVDVFDTAWYAPYVVTLKEAGLAEGSGNGYFNPEASITREEACTLIYRALGDKVASGEGVVFTDAGNISDYATDAVAALVNAKIITGNGDGTFLPNNTTTRAEAAVIFYRLLEGGLA